MNNSYDVEITYKQSETQFDTLYPQTTDDNVALSNETLGVFEGPTLADALIELKQSIPSVTVVEQATPVITVDENGLITATTNQAAGYVQGGTKTATYQIPKVNPAKPVISVDENGLVTSTVTQSSGYTTGGTASSTYQIPTVTRAIPTVSVDTSTGKITGSVTQSKGWVSSGGSYTANTSISYLPAKTWTPGTSNQVILSSNCYLEGTQTIKGDANLIASNIKKGATIFNVAGTYSGSSASTDGWENVKQISLTNNSGWDIVALVPRQEVGNPVTYTSASIIGLQQYPVKTGETVNIKFYGGNNTKLFIMDPYKKKRDNFSLTSGSSYVSGSYDDYNGFGYFTISSKATATLYLYVNDA